MSSGSLGIIVSSFTVPISEKMDIDCEARDIADEGLYVGRKPLVMAKDRYKMENRLLKEPDGEVIFYYILPEAGHSVLYHIVLQNIKLCTWGILILI